jgi:hypothetical protein
METAIAIILSACLLAGIFIGLDRLASRRRERRAAPRAPRSGERACPLCSSALAAGERVKSSIFPGKADRIMHIFGCVHCWPADLSSRSPSAPRICPACGRALDAEGYVIARYFERPGRRHVHVLGCTGCRG